MKKFIFSLMGCLILVGVVGCQRIAEEKEKLDEIMNPEYEKIDNVDGILTEILKHIANYHPDLSLVDGQLVDSDLGLPVFEVTEISKLDQFDMDDIVGGYLLRPVVDVDNVKMIVIAEADGKEASIRVKQNMEELKSDQYRACEDGEFWEKNLVDSNVITRQGNFLLYVTWEGPTEITKVFERHIR